MGYHKFFVFLPALLIILFIVMIYVSYWFCYILPLLQNWNDNIMKNSKDYPFTITSSNKNSKTKGVVLGLASAIFVTLLAINLLRTIFSDPGYFPSALELEYQIVMKNLHHQQESEKQDNSENTKTEDDIKKDKNLDKENSYIYNEDLINDVEDLEKKRNYFKVETHQKDKTANKKEIRPKLKKNASEKIYFDQEDSIEIYKDDALNL